MIHPNIMSESEEAHLVEACDAKLRRLAGKRYIDNHECDGVIHGFRECSVSSWEDPMVQEILERAKSRAPHISEWLPPHILDLRDPQHAPSTIGAHVDREQVALLFSNLSFRAFDLDV